MTGARDGNVFAALAAAVGSTGHRDAQCESGEVRRGMQDDGRRSWTGALQVAAGRRCDDLGDAEGWLASTRPRWNTAGRTGGRGAGRVRGEHGMRSDLFDSARCTAGAPRSAGLGSWPGQGQAIIATKFPSGFRGPPRACPGTSTRASAGWGPGRSASTQKTWRTAAPGVGSGRQRYRCPAWCAPRHEPCSPESRRQRRRAPTFSSASIASRRHRNRFRQHRIPRT